MTLRYCILALGLLTSACNDNGKRIYLNDPEDATITPEGPWLDPNLFGKRREVTIDTSQTGTYITEPVYDFPLLLRLDDTLIDFQSIGKQGEDLRFTDGDGYMYDHEIESFDTQTGAAVIWVKLPRVAPDTADQVVVILYGTPSPESLPVPSPVFSEDNGFEAVWHLSDNALNIENGFKDATPNHLDATAANLRPEDAASSGIAGGGVSLQGASYLTATLMAAPPSSVTISAWVKPRRPAGTILSIADGVVLLDGVTDAGPRGMYHAGGVWYETDGALPLDESWHYVVYTTAPDSALQQLFVDGALAAETRRSAPILYSIGYDHIAIGVHANLDRLFFDGIIDEMRLSAIHRSPEWIMLSFENQRLDKPGLVVF